LEEIALFPWSKEVCSRRGACRDCRMSRAEDVRQRKELEVCTSHRTCERGEGRE